MLRLTFPTGDLIIDHRCALAPVQSLHCLDSEDEVRRLLLTALTNPTALDALRRFFARWNSEAWRVNVIKDRTLIERVARMTVNGPLAAFVVHDKRTLTIGHLGQKLATGKLTLKASTEQQGGATHVTVKPPVPVAPVAHAETRLVATSPAAATKKATADQQVRNLSIELRIEEVLRRTPPYLPQAMRADFMALLSPESLAITVGVLAVWAASHAFGIGFIIDALLVIAGAVLFGMAIIDVGRKLHQSLELAATAQTDKDLEGSAKLLADVVAEIGVAAFVALITHGASRTVSSAAKGKPPERPISFREPSVTKTSPKPVEKPPQGGTRTLPEKTAKGASDEPVSTSKNPDRPVSKAPPKRTANLRPNLDEKWFDESGNLIWPKNEGFKGTPTEATLQPGQTIDRYGLPGGSFLSPADTPFEERALPYDQSKMPHHKYEVVKPIPVKSGEIAPWFDQPGGGTQFKTEKSVQELINEGYLREVPK